MAEQRATPVTIVFAGVIMANFQRNGSISNTHVGKEFEAKAKSFFAGEFRGHNTSF